MLWRKIKQGVGQALLHNLGLYEVGRRSILQMETVRLTEVKRLVPSFPIHKL